MEAAPPQRCRGTLREAGVYPQQIMNRLQRATRETFRALGINIPTALLAILAVVVKVAVVDSLSTSEVDTPTEPSLWAVEFIPWPASLAIVFVLFFAWNIVRIARRDRSVRAHQRMVTESATSVDDQMKLFLRNALGNPSYGVAKCYAFGSVVRSDQTRDVDIIIQFDSSKRARVRACRDRLRTIESRFHEFYDLKLHVQTFLSGEDAALDRFLDDAGQHERIM